MNYKYNITHKLDGKKTVINFKNQKSLIKHLNTNQDKINDLVNVYINFSAVSLPLKATVWYNQPQTVKKTAVKTVKKTRKKSARSKEKEAETRRMKKFIKRLEK